MEIIHRNHATFPRRVVGAYLILIILLYIYTYYVLDNYGDVISKSPAWDVMGKYKCAIKFEGCEKQYLGGWGVVRVLAFVLIGFVSPHAHVNMIVFSSLFQLYAMGWGHKDKHVLNPILNIVGYSLGSAMCNGECCRHHTNKSNKSNKTN